MLEMISLTEMMKIGYVILSTTQLTKKFQKEKSTLRQQK
jgi:hypothetical protein